VHRSCSQKCISKVVWETLSRSRNGDEKLALDGKENEDDIFFTPFQSLLKEDVDCEVVSKNS